MTEPVFKVMRRRCYECLYGQNKIVSDARRAQLLRDVRNKDGFFECHKGTLAGEHICCRGDWDQHGGGQLGRIAARLHRVRFVAEPAASRTSYLGGADDYDG